MSKKTKDELDMEYWQQIEKYLPWRLHGFTFRKCAAFYTSEYKLLDLTNSEFKQILNLGKNNNKR